MWDRRVKERRKARGHPRDTSRGVGWCSGNMGGNVLPGNTLTINIIHEKGAEAAGVGEVMEVSEGCECEDTKVR